MYRALIVAALMLPAIANAADRGAMPGDPGDAKKKLAAVTELKGDEGGSEGGGHQSFLLKWQLKSACPVPT